MRPGDIITNEFIGPVILTLHAIERWQERGFITEDLDRILKVAMPYGVQYGSDLLLSGDGVVFATCLDPEGARIVKTVLTRDMAMANMDQMHHVSARAKVRKQKEKRGTPSTLTKHIGGLVREADPEQHAKACAQHVAVRKQKLEDKKRDEWLSFLWTIYGMSDEELASMRDEHQGSAKLKNFIEREQGQRKKIAKQTAHAKRMEQQVDILKGVLKALVPAEELQSVWDRVAAAEVAAGLRDVGEGSKPMKTGRIAATMPPSGPSE